MSKSRRNLGFNEIHHRKFLRIVQSVSYLPHFMSWVVLGGMFTQIFSPSTGIINRIIVALRGKSIYFLTDSRWFITILITTGVWQGIGWGSIIYLATISGIDQQMYEAAIVEGATRSQCAIYITLPSLQSTISIMLIFSVSGILNAGFDQVFNMYNPTVYSVSDIIDTYVYRIGLQQMDYSFSTAIGLFKNVIGFTLLMMVNFAIKKLNEDQGIW